MYKSMFIGMFIGMFMALIHYFPAKYMVDIVEPESRYNVIVKSINGTFWDGSLSIEKAGVTVNIKWSTSMSLLASFLLEAEGVVNYSGKLDLVESAYQKRMVFEEFAE